MAGRRNHRSGPIHEGGVVALEAVLRKCSTNSKAQRIQRKLSGIAISPAENCYRCRSARIWASGNLATPHSVFYT